MARNAGVASSCDGLKLLASVLSLGGGEGFRYGNRKDVRRLIDRGGSLRPHERCHQRILCTQPRRPNRSSDLLSVREFGRGCATHDGHLPFGLNALGHPDSVVCNPSLLLC